MLHQNQLKEYQTQIINHILEVPRCAIWASMGMGKTVSALTAAAGIVMVSDDPILVLAPLRVAQSTWPEEVKEWEHLKHLRIMPVVGTLAERRMALSRKADIYTTNYDNLVQLVEDYGDRWPFRTIISDESTRLKSFRTRQGGLRAQALGTIAHSHCNRFIQLTGTPAPNGLQDLWGQAWFLDAGKRLGRTYTSFRDRWFQRSFDGYGVDPLSTAQAEIQDRLRDICLTIDAKDYFDLKEPIVTNKYFDLPVRARKLYDEMEKEMFIELDGHEIEAFHAAARTQKLLQLTSGACYVDPLADSDYHPKSKMWKEVHDVKLQILEEIIHEASGAPILVAYQFRSDLARLLKALPKARHLGKDPQIIKDWNAGKIPILLAHPASCGHGLNLQHGGSILVYFSHDWNLELRMQILERIGPMRQLQSGYDRNVWVYNIIARNSVDEVVIARTDDKRSVQDVLLEAMKRRVKI